MEEGLEVEYSRKGSIWMMKRRRAKGSLCLMEKVAATSGEREWSIKISGGITREGGHPAAKNRPKDHGP